MDSPLPFETEIVFGQEELYLTPSRTVFVSFFGKCLERPVNIKGAHKHITTYAGRPLTLFILCFMLIDDA